MRLVFNVVVGSVCATILVLAVYTYVSLTVHRASLLEDMQRDHRAMVSALVESVETMTELHGEAQARELLAEVNRRKEKIAIEWHPLDAAHPQVNAVSHVELEDGGTWLRTTAPVRAGGYDAGTLELVESFAEGERFLRNRVLRLGLTALVMLAAGTLVGGMLGVLLVGRRVRALVDQARRVAEGDLEGRIERVGMNDELGELGREMNAMTARLAEARRRIEHATTERVRTLEQLRHAERLVTVGTLAAGLAHELGTPLNVVTESAKMIARGETSNAETLEYASIVAEQGERMASILRQLMDFARRHPPQREDVDLVALVKSTVALLGPLADKRGVRVGVRSLTELPPVSVDVTQIQQVLTNLIINAIQATPSRSHVEMRVDARTAQPPDGAGPPCDYACIEVADQGPGIAEEHRAHVFEPFFTTKGVGEGTGLGLSVAYGLVVEHGGWIEVDSPSGKGATFRVMLPLQPTVSADD